MKKGYIFAGFGGQGMLLIGKFLAMANMLDGKHVSWLPSYGPEMRGGTANCSVIVSDEEVASPMIDKADVLIAMNLPSLDKFEHTVKPGGLIVVNSSIIDRKVQRDDVRVVYCDAAKIADEVKNPKGANVAILGAMMGADEGSVSLDKMVEAIRGHPHRARRAQGPLPRGQQGGSCRRHGPVEVKNGSRPALTALFPPDFIIGGGRYNAVSSRLKGLV